MALNSFRKKVLFTGLSLRKAEVAAFSCRALFSTLESAEARPHLSKGRFHSLCQPLYNEATGDAPGFPRRPAPPSLLDEMRRRLVKSGEGEEATGDPPGFPGKSAPPALNGRLRKLAKSGAGKNATAANGLLDLSTLGKLEKSGDIDTVIMAFTDCYGRLLGKRYTSKFFLDSGARDGTHACNYLLATDMDMETVPGYKFANWEAGYGDFHLKPDLRTLRQASWLDRTAIVLCDIEDEATHQLAPHAPRTILKKQIKAAKELGNYEAKAASELEYFLYKQTYEDAKFQDYKDLTPVGWHREDYHILQGTREEFFNGAARRHLELSGVPVENSKGEFGVGQHELNVRYAEALEMGDRHVLYKQCLKELAESAGICVTFMAKPDAKEPGSSCHIHVSLWKGEVNAFVGKAPMGPLKASNEFRWFLGGLMRYTPDLMVFYAPTVNSYKRFVSASWAPTRIAWSKDNRTAPFRVLGSGGGLRVECRLPGADCNPYLGFAAALASGLEGIRARIEPPPAFAGNVYEATNLASVPTTLHEATRLFESSEFARSMLGADVHEHYVHFYRNEALAFDRAVTDWERRRYFELI